MAKANKEATKPKKDASIDEVAEEEKEKCDQSDNNESEELEEENQQSGDETAQSNEEPKEDKKPKKSKEQEKIEELNDRITRQMAEFDNFRKRSEKEKSQMYEVGAKDVIEKILPVVDNFERGLDALSDEEKESPFADGMDKIYKQLLTMLEELDVKEIDALGKPFDPELHNAVMHIEDESLGENEVAQVLQKGYTYRDSVVRHSMVQVAN